MAEVHNGAVVASQVSQRSASAHTHAHVWWNVLMGVVGVAALSAVVVTALMGLTTEALIIAIFTGAFFSRCAC